MTQMSGNYSFRTMQLYQTIPATLSMDKNDSFFYIFHPFHHTIILTIREMKLIELILFAISICHNFTYNNINTSTVIVNIDIMKIRELIELIVFFISSNNSHSIRFSFRIGIDIRRRRSADRH